MAFLNYMDIGLQKIIDDQTKKSIKDLSSFMPDIVQNYYDRYKFYILTEAPINVANFVLHTLAATVVRINEIFHKSPYKDMGEDLFKYFNTKLLKAENLFAIQDSSKKTRYGEVVATTEDNDTYKDDTEMTDFESLGIDISEIYDPFTTNDLDIQEDDVEENAQGLADRLG